MKLDYEKINMFETKELKVVSDDSQIEAINFRCNECSRHSFVIF